jgi:hypothetical protein
MKRPELSRDHSRGHDLEEADTFRLVDAYPTKQQGRTMTGYRRVCLAFIGLVRVGISGLDVRQGYRNRPTRKPIVEFVNTGRIHVEFTWYHVSKAASP